MPLVEYLCLDCGAKTEYLAGVGAEDDGPVCEKCGSRNLEKQLSAAVGMVRNSTESVPTRCGRGRPCCGRDVPCDTAACSQR